MLLFARIHSPLSLRGALLSFVVATAACGSGSEVLTGPSAVTGAVWQLRSLELPTGLVTVGRPENFTVEFRAANAFSAKADCNACAGSYSISGESLTIGPLACTRAFCGAASADGAFLDILSNAQKFGVRGTELSLESPKGIARFGR